MKPLLLFAILLTLAALLPAQGVSNPGGGAPVFACVGTPGNTVGSFLGLKPVCQDANGLLYACNNSSGCTVAADWVVQQGSGSFSFPSGTGFTMVSSSDAWNTTLTDPLIGTHGGTGVNNGSFTLTLAGNVVFTGAFNPTFAIPATGVWTFPAAGTLANLTSTQTLTNKTLDGVTPTVMGYLDATSSIQTQLNATTNASNLSSGTVSASLLPNPSASTLGGIESLAAVSHKWINTVSTAGVPAATQPACGDLSDSSGGCSMSTTAGGDLSGTLPSPTVAQVNGATVPASAGLVGTNSGRQIVAATSIPSATTATTQSASDDSTKVATTAYVDGTYGNAVIAASAAGAAKQICTAGGATRTCTYIDFPERFMVPAANCNNTTAGAGWSIGSGGTVTCRAGTNNLGGFVAITDTSSTFAQFLVSIPVDWDSGTNPYILMGFESATDTTNGHTVIPEAAVSCPTATNGTSTDDVTLSAYQSLTTVTFGASAVAHGFYTTSAHLGSTQMSGCVAGGFMVVSVGRATDTATGVIGFYYADVTFPRLLAVQAN